MPDNAALERRARALCRAAGKNPEAHDAESKPWWTSFIPAAQRSLAAQGRADTAQHTLNEHAQRIVLLIRTDLQGAYYRREVHTTRSGNGQVTSSVFTIPTHAELHARVQAWRDAGVDVTLDRFDPATGDADVWCTTGLHEPRVNLKMRNRLTLTFDELTNFGDSDGFCP